MCPQSGDLREVARHVGASVYAARHRRALDHARKVPQDCGGDAYKSAGPSEQRREQAARTNVTFSGRWLELVMYRNY